MNRFFRTISALAGFALVPASALAQGSIAGVVRDTSGAGLPGVTVEASSAALIEKVLRTLRLWVCSFYGQVENVLGCRRRGKRKGTPGPVSLPRLHHDVRHHIEEAGVVVDGVGTRHREPDLAADLRRCVIE